jgi:hypothetical protein
MLATGYALAWPVCIRKLKFRLVLSDSACSLFHSTATFRTSTVHLFIVDQCWYVQRWKQCVAVSKLSDVHFRSVKDFGSLRVNFVCIGTGSLLLSFV